MIPLWEWCSERGEGALTEWRDGLGKGDKGRLDAKLLLLGQAKDPSQMPNFVQGPINVRGRRFPHIYECKVWGDIPLRLLLCKGPPESEASLTFLVGARERGGEFDPRSAPETAVSRRQQLADRAARRIPYESPPKGQAN